MEEEKIEKDELELKKYKQRKLEHKKK